MILPEEAESSKPPVHDGSVNTQPFDPAVVFAGSRYGYLYRSDDGGDSWTKLWREFSEISSVLWVPG